MGIVTGNKAHFNYHLPLLSGELWIFLVNGKMAYENKTKQSKTKQNKTTQDKTKLNY